MPDSCWVIDADETHFVDIHVGVVGIPDRESVVMVRNVTKIDAHDDHLELLERLTSRCRELRVSGAKGTARAKSADVGSMFALGTTAKLCLQRMHVLRTASSGVLLLTWRSLGVVASRRCTLL